MKMSAATRLLLLSAFGLIATLLTVSCTDIEFLKNPSSGDEQDTATIAMNNIESHITNQGLLEKKILAEKSIYFEKDQKALLQKILVIFYDNAKESGTLTADNGTLFLADNKEAKAGRNDLILSGNIVYKGTDGTLLETSQLYWDNASGELRCNTKYVRRKPVEGGLIETKGKQFCTNKNFTQWKEVGGTMQFISTQDKGKELK
jgi:LPS export ABC transporter protein LptC